MWPGLHEGRAAIRRGPGRGGQSSFGRCKRLLKPGGIYLSSDLGPLSQNPVLALVTPLPGGKVMFPSAEA